MTLDASASLRDVGFVCTALERAGVRAVLTGGGAATIHAPGVIHSADLDFVLTFVPDSAAVEDALDAIGFRRKGKSPEFHHDATRYYVEFPRGPLAIGDELVTTWLTLREGDRLLHVLSPTDSCRDRLAAFYHWSDRGSLKQAVAIAKSNRSDIDVETIAAWSAAEGFVARFEEFRRAVDGG